MTVRSVLLIDDDPELLRQLVMAFTGAGYSVQSASDGDVALKLFAADLPDLVVTDIVMPFREGIEIILAMRAISETVKIVAMSGGGMGKASTYLALAEGLGANETIAKPFRLADMLITAERVLNSPLRPEIAA